MSNRLGMLFCAPTLILAACNTSIAAQDEGEADGSSPAGTPSEALPAPERPSAPATAGKGRDEEVSTDLFGFEYYYPDAAAAYPKLQALLDKRLDKALARLRAEASEGKAEAEKEGYPYNQHESATAWAVVTEIPRFLSLSADIFAYGGGAHGMTWFDSLVWDRQGSVARDATDLFVSKSALRSAIREPFCAALNREREERRGEPVAKGSEDPFDDCIDPLENTVILGSSNAGAFDRIGVLIAPYAAGPYVEGTYEVTLPVTERVLAAVKPAFRDSFAKGR